MRVVDLLRAVRDGGALSSDDMYRFVQAIGRDEVPDYQVSAFLMAVYLRGLPEHLTHALTTAMRDSGSVINLGSLATQVDKHSTGGVGDKISLPLAPLVAACGAVVPMVSGRGLGHTGGTLDKLSAIPGMRVDVDVEFFKNTAQRLGLCFMGQTTDLAPADKKLYALRDVTATVESIPLITASILSKKLAAGVTHLVLDVKVGRGAFMKDFGAAERLAASLVRIGEVAGMRIRALLTRMEEPLGTSIGNALEVREAIAILRGEGPSDTTELTLTLAAHMLQLVGLARDIEEARASAAKVLYSGAALDKFRHVVAAQGGDAAVIDHPEKLPTAAHQTLFLAPTAGFIESMDSFLLGLVAMRLGAGRSRADEPIDPAVGLVLRRQVGDFVEVGEPVIEVHHNGAVAGLLDDVGRAVQIGAAAPSLAPRILAQLG